MTTLDASEAAGAAPEDERSVPVPAGVALAAIVLAGLALRLYHLDAQSVWYDEAFTIAQSGKPLGALFAALVAEGGRHPPLHYWLLHGWFGLTGFGAQPARLLSVVFGTLSLPVLYFLARRFAGTSTALAAVLLLAVSQMAVYFSQEARSYMAAQFLALVTAYAFVGLLSRPTLARTAAFAAAALALLATHYYGAATLVALGLYWLLFRRDYSPLVPGRLVLAAGLAGLLYAPWPLALRSSAEARPERIFQERDESEQPSILAPAMALNRFNNGKLTSVEAPSSPWSVALGLGIFTVPILAAFWTVRRRPTAPGPATPSDAAARRRLHGLVLGGLLAALPVALAMAFGVLGATFNYRHYSFAVPGYYLAVAIAWQICFPGRALRGGWLVAALAWSAVALSANYRVPTKPDYRAALAPMAAAYRAGDCVVTRPNIWHDAMHLAWDVYYRDRGSPRVVPFAALPGGLVGCERLWVVWDSTWWMNRDAAERARTAQVLAALAPAFALSEAHPHPAIDVRLYRRNRAP
ncbi:MAG TPA: glycosyltransferase family 39 protein [Vicinamibacterales bacterium]|nr:glycosyltransferase family 39 protein [Vicinamibacterales bacterium]